jgi:hypothetical protein
MSALMNRFLVYINPKKLNHTEEAYGVEPKMQEYVGKIIIVEKESKDCFVSVNMDIQWAWHPKTCKVIDTKLSKILYLEK